MCEKYLTHVFWTQAIFPLLVCTTILANVNANAPVTKWPDLVQVPFRLAKGEWDGMDMPLSETEAKDDGWRLIDDGCAAGKEKAALFPGRRYIKLGNVTDSADNDYDLTPRIVLMYNNHGNLAGIQNVLPLEATSTVKPTDAHYLDFVASPRYLPDEKLGGMLEKEVLLKTAYFGQPSTVCDAPKLPMQEMPTIYLQNGDSPTDLLSIPGYVGDALEDKDKGFRYIENREPDGSTTRWYEHKCSPWMGAHWLPLEPNLGDSACPQLDFDQGIYDPHTSKLIGFAFINFARAKPHDPMHNVWLDYSGNGNVRSWIATQVVWYAPTCLKEADISSTHVFFGPAHLDVQPFSAPCLGLLWKIKQLAIVLPEILRMMFFG